MREEGGRGRVRAEKRGAGVANLVGWEEGVIEMRARSGRYVEEIEIVVCGDARRIHREG